MVYTKLIIISLYLGQIYKIFPIQTTKSTGNIIQFDFNISHSDHKIHGKYHTIRLFLI